jgi:hypothetical protein
MRSAPLLTVDNGGAAACPFLEGVPFVKGVVVMAM